MLSRERLAMPATPLLRNGFIETEINDTLRRLDGLDALFQAFRDSEEVDGLTSHQAEILRTLIDDIRDGSRRTVDLFNAGQRD